MCYGKSCPKRNSTTKPSKSQFLQILAKTQQAARYDGGNSSNTYEKTPSINPAGKSGKCLV